MSQTHKDPSVERAATTIPRGPSTSHNQFFEAQGRQESKHYTCYNNLAWGDQNSDLDNFLDMGAQASHEYYGWLRP